MTKPTTNPAAEALTANTFIVIKGTPYNLDDGTERSEAMEAMTDACMDELPIFTTDPSDPDADARYTGKVFSREHGIVIGR